MDNHENGALAAFRKTVRGRIVWMSVCDGVAVILTILVNCGVFPIGGDVDFISGFLLGVFIALEIIFIFWMVRYGRMLRREELLRKQYIKETDERNKAIQGKVGGAGRFLPPVFLTATVVSGFFNMTVFWTLLACTWVVCLYMLGLKQYYRRKL